MENVSKALIIAGAILLAILLITLGITIFNSQRGINDQATIVGELIELKTSDTADIIEGYEVNRYADEIIDKPSNGYYIDYATGIKINKNATYIISFDYTIEEKQPGINICCGIGLDNEEDSRWRYDKDFVHSMVYPNQNIGEKTTFTFELKPNEYGWFGNYENKKISLSLRFARTNPASEFKVKIENIKIKYK